MKKLVLFLSAVVALTMAAGAQTSTTSSTGSITVDVPIGTSGGNFKVDPAGKHVVDEVFVWATSGGQPQYTINPNKIQYVNCDPTSISQYDLYNLLAAAAVREGIARGYNYCGLSGIQTRVWDGNTVSRDFTIRSSTSGPLATQVSITTWGGTIQ